MGGVRQDTLVFGRAICTGGTLCTTDNIFGIIAYTRDNFA